ncbi:MAG: leucyl/phenylalanyl-tRNA--protein transferase [Chitinophagales bacterium]|nr:leucyl/phenylalanyl-tRNA--protein transferase [Chitinophagales bacterium]MCZ2393160.1 leucyl/phenylalanyl-tRNA--protein transferase [Chitinophagales bacterium]
MPIFILNEEFVFPNPKEAEEGIIAIGGDLNPYRILEAYRRGIFPWYDENSPILWHSPDPRMVLFPSRLKISKSMKSLFRKNRFNVTFDRDFSQVIAKCADVRYKNRKDTWITKEMEEAYKQLSQFGWAHSVEVWNKNGQLVGGLYGIVMGKCFFGESMFSLEDNASKFGFIALVQNLNLRGFEMIDCQVYTSHLASLGAEMISRNDFLLYLEKYLERNIEPQNWKDWKFENLILQ